jgi:hypothetical protein
VFLYIITFSLLSRSYLDLNLFGSFIVANWLLKHGRNKIYQAIYFIYYYLKGFINLKSLFRVFHTLSICLALTACSSNDNETPPETFKISGDIFTANSSGNAIGEIVGGNIVISINNEDYSVNTSKVFTPFTFDTELKSGESYTISISEQPESGYCRIDSGEEQGVIAESDIERVSIKCSFYSRGLPGVTEVSTSEFHTCVILNSQVYCWGTNDGGRLDVPAGLVNPRKISTGWFHSCVLDDYGVTCWGDDENESVTTIPTNIQNPIELAVGAFRTCIIDDNGLQCWGSENSSNYPKDIKNPNSLVLNIGLACVLDDKKPVCWGSGATTDPLPVRAHVPDSIVSADAIAIGSFHSCALMDGSVSCWGGDNSYGENDVPAELKNVSALSLGASSSCALTDQGVKCWGASDISNTNDFEEILDTPTRISISGLHGCAIDTQGLVCLGYSYAGASTIPNSELLYP